MKPQMLAERLRRFSARDDGQVAIIFSLAMVPIIGLLAMGVEYSGVETKRAQLNAAADVAALSAVNSGARSLTAAEAKKRAEDAFHANAETIKDVKVESVDIKVTDTGADRKVVVDYKGSFSTYFGVNGVKTMTISGEVAAAGPLAPYVDFHLLLDNTPSMGLGATTVDIDTMVKNTGDKCAFACHETGKEGKDYYSLARKLGVTLRIDVVRQATQTLTDTASAAAIRANQFRLGLYTFGPKAEVAGMVQVKELSSDMGAVKAAATGIELMTIPYQSYHNDTQTDFDSAFDKMDKAISDPGDGVTSSKPKKVLFFVSDGLNDAPKGSCSTASKMSGKDPVTKVTYQRCIEPLDTKLCEKIKKRGITIAVLYTTYYPLPTNGFYNAYVKPFQPDIATKMKDCASEGLFFEVSPSQGISEAMNKLFLKTVNQIALTR